mmetsp:Transcript_55678/g.127905  ORF Transcript_55678/g.127905 Transcript_55678/m.127905 type:complete len:329 (+) Transcript_55678:1218-2204(+)
MVLSLASSVDTASPLKSASMGGTAARAANSATAGAAPRLARCEVSYALSNSCALAVRLKRSHTCSSFRTLKACNRSVSWRFSRSMMKARASSHSCPLNCTSEAYSTASCHSGSRSPSAFAYCRMENCRESRVESAVKVPSSTMRARQRMSHKCVTSQPSPWAARIASRAAYGLSARMASIAFSSNGSPSADGSSSWMSQRNRVGSESSSLANSVACHAPPVALAMASSSPARSRAVWITCLASGSEGGAERSNSLTSSRHTRHLMLKACSAAPPPGRRLTSSGDGCSSCRSRRRGKCSRSASSRMSRVSTVEAAPALLAAEGSAAARI